MALGDGPLPLFPLNVVLFPRMALPLRVFEPRYLAMVEDCMSHDALFGVVCIQHGPEVGGPALPYEVGTVARITKVDEQSEGLLNVSTVGQERFRIRRLVHGKPYLTGEVEAYPLTELDAPEVGTMVDAEVSLLGMYLDLLSQVSDLQLQVQHLPNSPEAIAYLIGTLLQVPLSVKQSLLAVPDLPTMLHQEAALLQSDMSALTVMLRGEEVRAQSSSPTVFSLS